MKKLTCFALLLSLLLHYTPAAAQTCSAAFRYTVGSNHLVSFYALDSSGSSRRWVFGDGTSATTTANVVMHTYAQPGQYEVRHYTEKTSVPVCHDSSVQLIVIPSDSCTISALFKYHKDSLNCKKIYFINYSAPISPNLHFSWSFGDGTSSADGNPAHTYAQPGIYRVCLVSESGTACRKEYCDSVKVVCGDSCAIQPYFYWKADSLGTNKVYFSNSTLSSVAGVHYTWNFGDSSSLSHDISPIHTYAHPGNYHVCLVAETSNGCRKEVCINIQLKTSSHCDLKAAFSHYIMAWAPVAVRLEAVQQGDSAKYYWSFGDSTRGEGRMVVHNYHNPGWYTVCLSVIKGHCQASTCQSFFVGTNCDSVQVKYTYTRGATRPNEISFKAAGSDNALVQLWSIYKVGANINTPVTTFSQVNPRWIFSDTGWYRVCLNIITASLCRKEYCELIHIEKVINGPQLVVSTPNPAINTVTIEITLDKPEQVIIRILDGNGVTRAEFIENGATGNNRFTLPVERLSRGIYLVEIHSGSRQWFSRFQKG